MKFLSGKPFKKPSKGSGSLHWAALNQSDLCQVYLSRKQLVFGLEQWQCIHTFFFLAKYKWCLLFKTPIKGSQISLRGSRDAQSRALTNRFIVVQGKGQSFTASELSGQLNPLQRNNMTVKYTSCASVVVACVWRRPFWGKGFVGVCAYRLRSEGVTVRFTCGFRMRTSRLEWKLFMSPAMCVYMCLSGPRVCAAKFLRIIGEEK